MKEYDELSISNAEIDKRILKLLKEHINAQNEYIESLVNQNNELRAKNSQMVNYLIYSFGIVPCSGCEDCENGFKSIHKKNI